MSSGRATISGLRFIRLPKPSHVSSSTQKLSPLRHSQATVASIRSARAIVPPFVFAGRSQNAASAGSSITRSPPRWSFEKTSGTAWIGCVTKPIAALTQTDCS